MTHTHMLVKVVFIYIYVYYMIYIYNYMCQGLVRKPDMLISDGHLGDDAMHKMVINWNSK